MDMSLPHTVDLSFANHVHRFMPLCNVAFIGIISAVSAGPALHLMSVHTNLLSQPAPQEQAPSLNFIIVIAVLCALVLNIGAAVAWGVGP